MIHNENYFPEKLTKLHDHYQIIVEIIYFFHKPNSDRYFLLKKNKNKLS